MCMSENKEEKQEKKETENLPKDLNEAIKEESEESCSLSDSDASS